MITQARLADSEEQNELRDMVRRLLRETAPARRPSGRTRVRPGAVEEDLQ